MKAGKELENYVQFVYQKLLDFMDEGAMVQILLERYSYSEIGGTFILI